VSDIGEDQQAATRRDIVALREEIRALRAQLDDEDRRAG